jgi:hypothetical protein
MRVTYLLAACLLTLPVCADAQKVYEYIEPSAIQLQYAGNYGFMSLGLGQTFCKDLLSSYLMVGYLPEQINGVEVTTVALKNIVKMKQFSLGRNRLKLYTGFSVIYYHTHNTYARFPKYFPNSYYDFPTAIHAAPIVGSSFLWKKKDPNKKGAWAFFGEFSTLDYYLIDFVRNRSMNFFDLWNLSLGVTWHFK